jgi:uncharacterized cupredoxin-like copper-binding protein
MIRKMAILIIAAIVAVLLLQGCTRQAQTGTKGTTQQVSTTQQVQADLGEWYVQLNPTSVRPGRIQFNIKNTGKQLHAHRIYGQGIDEKSGNLASGQTTTMVVDLKAGEYEADCPIDNHEERGMRTTFTVSE